MEKQLTVFFSGDIKFVALEPLCEALGLDFEKEELLIMGSDFYRKGYISLPIELLDGVNQPMSGFTEKYFIPWIFQFEKRTQDVEMETCWSVYLKVYGWFRQQEEELLGMMKKLDAIKPRLDELEKQMDALDEEHSSLLKQAAFFKKVAEI